MELLEVGSEDLGGCAHVLREEVEHVIDVYQDLVVLVYLLLWTAVY